MTFSINGIGTGMVRASSSQQGQFDAVESCIFYYLPVIPYRVVHVTGREATFFSASYRTIKLRYSGRIVFKSILHAWSIGGLLVGGFFFALWMLLVVVGISTIAKGGDLEAGNSVLGGVCCVFFPTLPFYAGILGRVIYWFMDRRDSKIKRIIGAHDLGSSDPYYWVDDTLFDIAEGMLEYNGLPSMTASAQRNLNDGDFSTAMMQVRMAQRLEPQSAANSLFHEIILRYDSQVSN